MATKTTAKKKAVKVKVKVEKRPDSGAEKRAATVNPFDTTGVAPNAAPTTKKGDNVYTADTDTAKLIDEFVEANEAKKKAEAAMKAIKGKVMAFAKGRFAEDYLALRKRPKNPTLKGRKTAPKFIVSDFELKVDDDRWATIQDLFGDNANDAVTTHESFAFNTEFLNEGDNKERITAALSAAFTAEEVGAMIAPAVERTTKKGAINEVLDLLGADADAGGIQLALEILTKAPSIR